MVQGYYFSIMSQRRWSEVVSIFWCCFPSQTSCGVKMEVAVPFYMLQGSSPSGKNLCICFQSLSNSLIGSDWVIAYLQSLCKKWDVLIGLDESGCIFGIGSGLILPKYRFRVDLWWFPKVNLENGYWLVETTDVPHKHAHLLHFYFSHR